MTPSEEWLKRKKKKTQQNQTLKDKRKHKRMYFVKPKKIHNYRKARNKQS